MLKEYVIDLRDFDGKLRELISTGLQEHAFRLGWSWGTGKNVHYIEENVLYFDADKGICHNDCIDNSFNNTPISPADFLALTPEDVQDKPEKPVFTPTQMVLCRNEAEYPWCLDIYSHYQRGGRYPYMCVGGKWPEIIPYEGNEHLCGQVGEP